MSGADVRNRRFIFLRGHGRAFYDRVGFEPVTEADLPAPQPLGQPQGWIAQSLTKAPLTPLSGPARCVAAFDDPALW